MKLTPPFIIAMLISVAVHAAVVVSSISTEIALPRSLASVISVNLEEIQHVVAKPIQPHPAIIKTSSQHKKIIKKIARHVQTTKVITQEKSKEDEIEIQKQQSIALAQVKSDLIKKLDTNFIYPKLAKRKNWQGKVVLSLHISASGKIKNIHLTTSSGYNVLDNAAMTSLREVGQLHNISLWFNNGINLHLPVIYKLTES